jgi:hypothetical protein
MRIRTDPDRPVNMLIVESSQHGTFGTEARYYLNGRGKVRILSFFSLHSSAAFIVIMALEPTGSAQYHSILFSDRKTSGIFCDKIAESVFENFKML